LDGHFPNDRWIVGLGDFRDQRTYRVLWERLRHIEFYIAIRELIDASTPERVKSGQELLIQAGNLRTLVKIEDCGAAVAWLVTRCPAHVSNVIQDSTISIIEDCQGDLGPANAQWRWKMLSVEPFAGITAGKGEIALVPEPPQNVPQARTVLIVEFEDPALVTHREENVSIIWHVHKSIAVSPVW